MVMGIVFPVLTIFSAPEYTAYVHRCLHFCAVSLHLDSRPFSPTTENKYKALSLLSQGEFIIIQKMADNLQRILKSDMLSSFYTTVSLAVGRGRIYGRSNRESFSAV